MGATVTGGTTGASASVVKLRAGVSVVHPVTSVAYTVAAADVAYILLATSAYLDTTGRFKFIPDFVSMTDGTSLLLSKNAADQIALSDVSTWVFDKGADDTVSFADSLEAVLIFLRDLADSATVNDLASLSLNRPFTDAQSVLDSQTNNYGKVLADGVGLNEQLTFNYSLASTIDNVTFAGDTTVLSVNAVYSDSGSAADAGNLVCQDYCDITYFAEDYVGQARTF